MTARTRRPTLTDTEYASDGERICREWHERARSRDVEALLALYADDATLESPLVPAIMGRESGVLEGREEILGFLAEGTKRRPNDLVRWHREPDRFFFDGRTLVWEYPRETPDGDQIEILEVMELRDGLIARHRIYWGWFGIGQLVRSAVAKQAGA